MYYEFKCILTYILRNLNCKLPYACAMVFLVAMSPLAVQGRDLPLQSNTWLEYFKKYLGDDLTTGVRWSHI